MSPVKQASVTGLIFREKTGEKLSKGSVVCTSYWIGCQVWEVKTWGIEIIVEIFGIDKTRQNTYLSNWLVWWWTCLLGGCGRGGAVLSHIFLSCSICASLHTSIHLCLDLSLNVRLHACCCGELSQLDFCVLELNKDHVHRMLSVVIYSEIKPLFTGKNSCTKLTTYCLAKRILNLNR